jgi:hypothetical protein
MAEPTSLSNVLRIILNACFDCQQYGGRLLCLLDNVSFTPFVGYFRRAISLPELRGDFL